MKENIKDSKKIVLLKKWRGVLGEKVFDILFYFCLFVFI